MASSTQKSSCHGLFQCTTCQRTYTRVDHLARHVRSHLQERPFQCQGCGKAFGRQDLLKRHTAACHSRRENVNIRRGRQHSQGWRVSQACVSCAAAKLKCDDEKPCARCLERGLPCEPDERRQVRQARAHVLRQPHSTSTTTTAGSVAEAQSQQEADAMAVEIASANAGENLPTPDTMANRIVSPQLDISDAPTFDFSGWPDLNLGSGTGGLMDLNSDGGFDFNDLDVGFLDRLCNSTRASGTYHSMELPRDMPEAARPGRPPEHVALGAEAYRRSSFSMWHPAKQDRGGAEVENLSVPSAGNGSPDTQIVVSERCLEDNLSRAARDELMSMVLRTCTPERLRYVCKAFPTPEFLDDLLQSFFSLHHHKVDSFIHIPSFRPNDQEPELLGALAAAGATLTNIRTVHKLGFALQDAVRTTIRGRCEDSNIVTRELWLLQAFITELEVGIWSGIKRKMEIAESQPQTVFTMLRRAGRFKRPNPVPPEPIPEDTGQTLHCKWREWVEQESFKRLALHAFLVDAQTSMALLTNPIISYAELAIPLPDSRDLWDAQNAEEWKRLYLTKTRPPQPERLNLAQLLRDPIEIPDCYDVHFARLITLHGIWGLIWQHSQLLSTHLAGRQTNPALTLRHHELLELLHHFRLNNLSNPPPCPQTALLLELLPLYLHASLEEIQIFAGRGEDVDDARRVLPKLQQWVDSADARQALWHAGQVLRVTRGMFRGRGQLREFVTIAVYHATLVLWTWSVVMAQQGVGGGNGEGGGSSFARAQSVEMVCLDGPDSVAVQRFITVGKGTPGMTRVHPAQNGGGVRENNIVPTVNAEAVVEVIPVSDQEAVIGVVLEMLQGNFPCDLEEGQAPPPLVENLIQLLGDLGRAARAVGSRGGSP